MTDADDRLKALFARDEPPARDPAFVTSVMAQVARRRFQAEVALLSGVAFLGGLVLWAVRPVLAPALATLGQDLSPVMACLTLAAIAVVMLERPVSAVVGRKHD